MIKEAVKKISVNKSSELEYFKLLIRHPKQYSLFYTGIVYCCWISISRFLCDKRWTKDSIDLANNNQESEK